MYERNNENKLVKVTPESNICRYDDAAKHELCKHQHYCIFNQNRVKLESDMTSLENEINYLKKMDNLLLNSEVVYHEDFKEFIDNGDFIGLRNKIKELTNIKNTELNGLVRFKNRVLDGKVKGYGYGDVL